MAASTTRSPVKPAAPPASEAGRQDGGYGGRTPALLWRSLDKYGWRRQAVAGGARCGRLVASCRISRGEASGRNCGVGSGGRQVRQAPGVASRVDEKRCSPMCVHSSCWPSTRIITHRRRMSLSSPLFIERGATGMMRNCSWK